MVNQSEHSKVQESLKNVQTVKRKSQGAVENQELNGRR